MPFVPDQQGAAASLSTPTAALTPPAAAPAPSGARLGPGLSKIARPVAQGLAGAAGMSPPMLAGEIGIRGGNAVNDLLAKLGVKTYPQYQLKPPSELAANVIDRYTTAPTDRTGKIMEFLQSVLVGGAAGPKAVKAIDPVVKRLADEGVVTTPGQRAGGTAGAIEEKLSKILPPMGNARAKSVEQWNNARLSESLKDAGGAPLPKDLTGRDALLHTYQELGKRYKEVLSRMRADLNSTPGSTLPARPGQWRPGSYRAAIENTRRVGQNLDASQRNTLNDIIDTQVIGKFTAAGKASGETIKQIEETLRTEAEKLEDGGYQDRKLSDALYQLRSDFKRMLQQQNPKAARELDNIDRGYAKYKTSAKAANARPTGSGNYTPGQRLRAIQQRDPSKDNNDFSIGLAHGQAEAQEAQRVLGNTQPDSGTPMGMWLSQLLGGSALEHLGYPHAAAGVVAPLGASAALYNQPVLRALQNQALKPQEVLSSLGMVGAADEAVQ